MVWFPAVVLPVIFIGVMVFLWMRIRARGQSTKAGFQNRYGDRIRLITGCGIVCPPNRVPGVLACLSDRIAYKSLTSLAGGEGEIPLSSIAEVTWERSQKSKHRMAKKYRNAKVIGITTREGEQKIFVVANRVAADWEKQFNEIPGFRAQS